MSVNTEPAWYQNMVAANAVSNEFKEFNINDLVKDRIITAPGGPYTIREANQPNTITMMAGGEEMLKCGPDGFWVRGVKVEQDEQEAQKVYEGFKAWMSWSQLTRDYK